MIILILRRGWGRRSVLGVWGRGRSGGQGGRFIKTKMNVKAQALGTTILPKLGSAKIPLRVSSKSTRT